MIAFQAQDVSYSEDLEGREYFQVLFKEQDAPGGKYVLLQRQFEIPDGGLCYFECDEIERSGSHVIRKAKLSRERLEIEIPGEGGGKWVVGFRIENRRYTALKEVLQIILGKPSRMEIAG
jgi:hypothetical protein